MVKCKDSFQMCLRGESSIYSGQQGFFQGWSRQNVHSGMFFYNLCVWHTSLQHRFACLSLSVSLTIIPTFRVWGGGARTPLPSHFFSLLHLMCVYPIVYGSTPTHNLFSSRGPEVLLLCFLLSTSLAVVSNHCYFLPGISCPLHVLNVYFTSFPSFFI